MARFSLPILTQVSACSSGRNTTAGLINFITAKPTDSFEGGIKADLGMISCSNHPPSSNACSPPSCSD